MALTGSFVGACTRFWLAALVGVYVTQLLLIWGGIFPAMEPTPLDERMWDGHDFVSSLPFAAGIATVTLIMALPFLAVRNWIVRDQFPFLDAGYGLVVLAGPVLGLWIVGLEGVAVYEIAAFVVTAIYIAISLVWAGVVRARTAGSGKDPISGTKSMFR